jgi:HK97 family phage major capsid protein
MPSQTTTNRFEWLTHKRDAEIAEVDALRERAISEDRDLSDDEQNAYQRRREAVEQLDRELAVEVDIVERQANYEQLAERVGPTLRASSARVPAQPQQAAEPEVVFRSPGDYLATFLRARKDNDGDATRRLEGYRQTLQRANQTLDQNPGIVPTPIIGPVVTDVDARRPAVAAATVRPMPSGGRSFTRPVVASHTTVAKQAAEKTPLASSPLVINELTVSKDTYGGHINLSWQDRDWTEPAILDLLVADLAGEYANATDAAFCTMFATAITQQVSATTGATPAASDSKSWMKALYQAAAMVFAAGNATPNTLWLGTDAWASLGALVDGAGRPMFPAVNPFNGMGALNAGEQAGNVAGFRIAVDANFPPDYAALGDSSAVEVYEQVGGMVSALEPTILGTAIAYYGYFASAVIRPKAFVEITAAI